jgi:hypothetical protein
MLSKAFGKLKLMLPWVPPDTKLSKLDTLRLATSYISHLRRILDEDEDGPQSDGSTSIYPQTSLVRIFFEKPRKCRGKLLIDSVQLS